LFIKTFFIFDSNACFGIPVWFWHLFKIIRFILIPVSEYIGGWGVFGGSFAGCFGIFGLLRSAAFSFPSIPTNQINNNQPTNYPCLILIPVLEYFFDFNACLILIPVSKYLFDFHFSFINRNICLIFIPVSKYLFDLHTLIEIPAWFWYLFDIDTCFEILI